MKIERIILVLIILSLFLSSMMVFADYNPVPEPKGTIEEAVKNFVKDDGSTPFKSAQKGQRPILEDHLTTKKYVDDKADERDR